MKNPEQLLKDKHLKPTPQRCVILKHLLQSCSHPTAEEIEIAVRADLPVSLSRATVYNTLNLLVKAGLVKEVVTRAEPKKVRYDANLYQHHHFVDLKTGQIYDIDQQDTGALNFSLPANYEVDGYQLTIYGEIKE